MDASYTKPSELLGYQYGTGARELGGSPLSVIVAAGPYTVDSDLDYEPLKVLLSLVAKERPDLLILVRLPSPQPRPRKLTSHTARPVRRLVAPSHRRRRRRRDSL